MQAGALKRGVAGEFGHCIALLRVLAMERDILSSFNHELGRRGGPAKGLRRRNS
jgi:hypothetical protein